MSENTVSTETTNTDTTAVESADVETTVASREPDAKALGHGGDRNYRKARQGLVVSDKMDKTVSVIVEDRVKHALYGKVLRKSHKVKAHDEENAAGVGDRVLIMETRPLSATKRWRVVEILEKAK